jgi:group II intron reverse transcriptase/maturase
VTRRKQQNAYATITGQSLVHTEAAKNGFSATLARTHRLITEETEDHQLLEKILGRDNMFAALARVEKNNGAAGVDGMEVKDLRTFLKAEWSGIRDKILAGSYRPSPARRVEIPKPGGGTRLLGIPTVLDRLIQQAMLQNLSPIFDPDFSSHSYGFRPGKSAHMAVKSALDYQKQGYHFVVDIDLEKFFDRVNHDILMHLVSRKVKDARVLRLIRSYLSSGIMADGIVSASREGTPQGSPISPLLSNIMLDVLDKELERRGHKFCRYADDQNIYVKTQRAGERVFVSVTKFLATKLRLHINEAKSAVDWAWKRKFLGYSFLGVKAPKLRISKEAITRFKGKVKEITRGHRSQNIQDRVLGLSTYLTGWMAYFRLAETHKKFKDLDSWIRHRLRMCMLKQWRKPRTRVRNLIALGLPLDQARMYGTGKKYWFLADTKWINFTLNNAFWEKMGYKSLEKLHLQLRQVP